MPVVIDPRPLHVLLARRGLPFISLALLALLTYLALKMDAPAELGATGWRALVVFALCLVLWVSQLLPLSVTSLLGLALLPMLDVLPASEAYAMFGNSAVFFILGAFILATGVMKTGLSEHMALAVLGRFGGSPRGLLLAMLLLPAFMAGLMPEHAVAAVCLPIVLEIVRSLGMNMGHRYALSLFLALAWGAVIGGVATLLGGARGPLALGLLDELAGQRFSFLDWVVAAFPLVAVMLAVAAAVLLIGTPTDGLNLTAAGRHIEQRRLELGALSFRGRIMAVLLLATVAAWMFAGHAYGLASIALVSVVLMFSFRLVRWQDAEEYVNWGVILMYGGAIALGKALAVTGAASWIASELLPGGISGMLLIALLALCTLLLTEAVSNAAAVAILLPVALPLGTAAGLDVVNIALVVGIVSGFAFMLPMGTPANALVYSTGYVPLEAMFRRGVVLSASAWTVFVVTAGLWWPRLSLGAGQ